VNKRKKIYLNSWLFLMVAWVIFMNLQNLVIFTLGDFVDYGDMKVYNSSAIAKYDQTLFGIIFGTFFTIIYHLTDRPFIRRMEFGKTILLKSIFYVISIVIAGALITIISINIAGIEEKVVDELWLLLTPKMIVAQFTYFLFFIFITNLALEVNKKMGYGNLWKMISGKYHKPRSENRIFMFLDLKDSTPIAEKLGHELYSKFIQNCFYDITDMVINYDAQIYQYAGDEVILTWKIKDGLKNINCIKFYFQYKKHLQKRDKYYQSKFGVSPTFKCGIEMGTVTVAEVGTLKRDIAYHGDVLNTAARIQGMCNELGKEILISENVEQAIKNNTQVKTELMGDIVLKGKENKVKIFAVTHN